jgi:hypothetical protein
MPRIIAGRQVRSYLLICVRTGLTLLAYPPQARGDRSGLDDFLVKEVKFIQGPLESFLTQNVLTINCTKVSNRL